MRFRVFCLVMLLCAAWAPAKGQWECALYGGVGMPVLASGNAPELRVSLVTGLRGGYALNGGWVLTGEVWQVRHLKEDNPNIVSVPLDTAFRVKRYQLIPLLVGVGYRFPLSDWAKGTVYASAGGYFRYIHCQKQTATLTLDDMGESGWGLAGKVGAEVMLWERLSLQGWFMAMGNPFENETSALPYRKNTDVTYNRTHWRLEGYRQCFWGVSLGYIF